MKLDGARLREGSALSNATIASGADFPSFPSVGELFYINAATIHPIGLYTYTASLAWNKLVLENTLGTMAYQNANTVEITGGNLNNTLICETVRTTGKFTNVDLTGNLSLAGNGRRIIGDFSNSTLSSRTLFQTNFTDGTSSVGVIPNGTSRASNFTAFNSADVANSVSVSISVSSTEANINSSIRGSADALPLTFSMPSVGTSITLGTNGNTGFGVTPDATARIQSSNGIKLGNTGNSNTNVLDWYEEGTFTPVLIGGSTAGTATYSGTRVGTYQRVGNTVRFTLRLAWTATTGSGTINIGGLPYVSGAAAGNAVCTVVAENLNFTNNRSIAGFIIAGNSRITLRQQGPGTSYTDINMDTNVSDVSISGFYFV